MVSIYISDKPSPINKDLLGYLKTNIDIIVKMSIHLDIKIVREHEAQAYASKGIVNFPVLMHQNSKIVGVNNIKDFFQDALTRHRKKISHRNSDDDVKEFMDSVLLEGDEQAPEDESSKFASQLQGATKERQEKLNALKPTNRAKNEVKARNIGHTAPTKQTKQIKKEVSTLDALHDMHNSGEEAADDKLMAKFFEDRVDSSV